MLDKQTLDIVRDKINKANRNIRDDSIKQFCEINKLKKRVINDKMTAQENIELERKIKELSEEHRELNNIAEGISITIKIILELYNGCVFNNKKNNKEDD